MFFFIATRIIQDVNRDKSWKRNDEVLLFPVERDRRLERKKGSVIPLIMIISEASLVSAFLVICHLDVAHRLPVFERHESHFSLEFSYEVFTGSPKR